MLPSFNIAPVGLTVALTLGFVAYAVSYVGLRRGHSAKDMIFISLVYGLIAFVVFEAFEEDNQLQAIGAAFATALVLGILWRKILRDLWYAIMNFFGVHHDDGFHGSWDVLVQSRGAVGRVSVHTKRGHIYILENRENYSDAWQGWYCGTDGSVLMIVEQEEFDPGKVCDGESDGKTIKFETSKGEIEGNNLATCEKADAYYNYTYIPSSEIIRVDVLTQNPGLKFRRWEKFLRCLRECLK